MGQIRQLAADDIPQVVDLCEKVFGANNSYSPQTLAAYLEEILFRNPWSDSTLPSLVYQEANGRMVGFLGVLPRRMEMNGQPLRVAVGNYFMVEPERRSTLAGVELAKTFLAGPQDLSLAEGNNFSRRVWEGLGGTTSLLYSISWIRPLRPGRYLVSLLHRRGLAGALGIASRPLGSLVDALGGRLSANPFRQPLPEGAAEELQEQTLLECLSNFSDDWLLRPHYNAHSLRWLLALLAQKRQYGRLRKVLVRNPAREIIGWYLYYANPGGTGETVQVGAKRNSIPQVLDHLFYDAWRQGLVALTGRADPQFMPAYTAKHCLLSCGAPWMLLHSRRPELLEAVDRGKAFLTRLEGEWWIGF